MWFTPHRNLTKTTMCLLTACWKTPDVCEVPTCNVFYFLHNYAYLKQLALKAQTLMHSGAEIPWSQRHEQYSAYRVYFIYLIFCIYSVYSIYTLVLYALYLNLNGVTNKTCTPNPVNLALCSGLYSRLTTWM